MANTLETRTEDYSPIVYDDESIENLNDSRGLEYVVKKPSMIVCEDPNLRMFTEGIKDKKRRREIEKEIGILYHKYAEDIRKGNPVVSRAELLEQAWNIAGQEPPEGKEPITVLNQRLYANPGRQYQYINGVVGEKKKSSEIKEELGKAAKYAIKEGWPVLGAGAAWLLANRWYNKGGNNKKAKDLKGEIKKINETYKPLYKPWEVLAPNVGPLNLISNIAIGQERRKAKRKAKKEAGVGVVSRAGKAFDDSVLEYLVPGVGPVKFIKDAGKFVIGEGLRQGWKLIRKPAAYAIGAYAAYKVIGYLLKRRKEKKLEQKEIERLESIRHDMLAQRQMFYIPRAEMEQAA